MTVLASLRSGRGVRVSLTVAVLGVGVGVGVWAVGQGGSPAGATTAIAKPGTVKETVAEPASVADVSQADVNSDTSGDVGSLDVAPGEEVYADETLATTDPYSDDTSLYEEGLALNQDETQLASDESDQTLQSAEAKASADELSVSTDEAAATGVQDALTTLQIQDQATLQQDESAVTQAEQTLATDTGDLTAAQATAANDQVVLETAQEQFTDAGCPKIPSGSTANCTALTSAVTQAQAVVTADVASMSIDQTNTEDDQQSVQDDQSALLIAGLNDQSSIAQATAKYTNAEQTLSSEDASLSTAQAAVAQSQRDDDVVTQVDAQKVTQVKAQIQSQKDSLKEDRLTAPISGRVKSVEIKPGMEVTSAPSELTSAMKPPSSAIVIDSGGSLVAETNVDGSSAANIHVGDPVHLALPQHPAVDGKVSSIGIISTDASGAESAPVTVMISGKPSGIYPGLTGQASITLVDKTHVLSVPSDAVHTSGTRTFVDEMVNGRRVSHDVRVGAVGTNVTQIVSGLSDGTKVVVPG
jgi:multidrug efflux pump subunit AcrA (membrane-fusion protein)